MKQVGCIVIPLSIIAAPVMAESQAEINQTSNVEQVSPAQEENAVDDTIVVRSAPTSQSMGTQIINADQIKKTPMGNGNITELLKSNPNVRFSNDTNSSINPGEIAPENVSFHGEKFYNNNFMIDGLSNNNNVNPGANNGDLTLPPDGFSPTDLPAGGTQSFWINTELLDRVEVFDSNVSAKYGNFTGGVVDARLIDPSLDRVSGKVSWRTSRDNWTKYHLNDEDESDFYAATKFYNQPQFTKNFYTLTVNQPINDQSGIIFAYNRQESVIPQYQSVMGEWDNQKRLGETYLLKGIWFADNGDIFRMTGMYSPHKSTYNKDNVKNGGFSNTGGGYRGNIEWEHYAPWGKVTSLVGYQFDQNKIEQESDTYQTWYRYNTASNFVSDTITWGSSAASAKVQYGHLGGYGTYSTDKSTTRFKQDYEFTPFAGLGVGHQVDAGWELGLYETRYRRFRDVASNNGVATIDKNVVCQAGDDFCIDGEQYFKRRTLYPQRTEQGSYTDYAVYLQDSMTYKRLEVTPGVRVQYDDFMQNLTAAPRFAASLDVFGDKSTRLFGGANRYYGQSILAYKLRTGISAKIAQTRTNANSPWVGDTVGYNSFDYDISDLKTPYSDELSLGLSQRILNSVWTVKWVNRQGRDQFGRDRTVDENGQKRYIMTNSAKTAGDTWSLTAEPVSPHHWSMMDLNWKLEASWIKNKSSSQAYYDESNSDNEMAIIDGKLIEKGDMEAMNFNVPWIASAKIYTYFPALNLNWTHSLGYNSGITGYTSRSISCPVANSACGSYSGTAYLYEKTKFDDYFTYDWRFGWKQPTFKDQSVELTLDVLNVLDNVIEAKQTGTAGSTKVTYKTGRQFWFGVAYNW
ncbi:outer membrane receptor protein involved in Fe transport [Enterobacter sp. BIGb0383]|uniref:TonB-dependent receptor plug domain-containing protein n=1 Tax=unclassified Enterobacter TaxID=2608935 RepID=UPI000F4AF225|nr:MULTISPECIES: TonB-dependent receptor [unclassified Enterobacter]ROP59461.1 outer membrane receptor protein involved in Fe transport [Enterobacter sp. BIGb0383]ROS09072.1 outer membrane receptor protein involved in Fe transport [Enterobacter sp. BIGb0359]